ncbi:MAG: hypothetical protein HC853_06390 [Anaerolineae bacterium]|nr:hypothetical protein [Anaerolineae bacterium]
MAGVDAGWHAPHFGTDAQSRARNVWLLRKTFAANRDDIKTGRASVEYRYEAGQHTLMSYRLTCYRTCGFDEVRKGWVRLSEIVYGNSVKTDGTPSSQHYSIKLSYPDATSDRVTHITVSQGATPLRNFVFDRPAPGYNLNAIHEQHWDGSQWVALPGPSFTYAEIDHATLMTGLSNGYGMSQSFEYRKTDFNSNHVVSAISTNTSMGWQSKTKYDYAQPCIDKQGAACYNATSHTSGFFEGFNRWSYGPGSENLVGHAAVTETVQEANGTVLTVRAHQFHTDYQKLGREYEMRVQNAAGETLQAQRTEYRVVAGPVIDLLPIDTWHTSVTTATLPGAGGHPALPANGQPVLPRSAAADRLQPYPKGTRLFTLQRGVRPIDMPNTYANGNSEWYLLARPTSTASETRPLYFAAIGPRAPIACSRWMRAARAMPGMGWRATSTQPVR